MDEIAFISMILVYIGWLLATMYIRRLYKLSITKTGGITILTVFFIVFTACSVTESFRVFGFLVPYMMAKLIFSFTGGIFACFASLWLATCKQQPANFYKLFRDSVVATLLMSLFVIFLLVADWATRQQ